LHASWRRKRQWRRRHNERRRREEGGTDAGSAAAAPDGPAYSCTSIYDGTYSGTLNFAYDTAYDMNGNPTAATVSSLYLSLTMHCYVNSPLGTAMTVTNAVSTEPAFGCASPGCIPQGMMGLNGAVGLPAMAPTGPSNPSAAGMGIDVTFPSGSRVYTSNGAGELSVSAGGTTLSSSSTAPTNQTWSIEDASNRCISEHTGAQPNGGCCVLVPYQVCNSAGSCQILNAESCTRYTSWSLTKMGP